MFAAAQNLVNGRRKVEDHASIFISYQLRYHVEMLTKYCRAQKKILPEVYVRSVGNFVQVHLL